MDAILNQPLALYGGATVTLVTAVVICVTWLRLLLNLDGNRVRLLLTGVASYVVLLLYVGGYSEAVALAMSLPIVVCAVAAAASAGFDLNKRASRGEESRGDTE